MPTKIRHICLAKKKKVLFLYFFSFFGRFIRILIFVKRSFSRRGWNNFVKFTVAILVRRYLNIITNTSIFQRQRW